MYKNVYMQVISFNSFIEQCSNGKSANGTQDPCEALSLFEQGWKEYFIFWDRNKKWENFL
jgi:hypothetical protein